MNIQNIGSAPVTNLVVNIRCYVRIADACHPILDPAAWTSQEWPELPPAGVPCFLDLNPTIEALTAHRLEVAGSQPDTISYFLVIVPTYQRKADLREFSQRIRYRVYWTDPALGFIVRDDFSY